MSSRQVSGAPIPTATQLAVAAVRARTAMEHAAIAEYYLSEAGRLEATARIA